MMAFDKSKYHDGYVKENYDVVRFKIPKGNHEKLKHLAIELDIRDPKGQISVARLIVNAIEAQYGIDIHTKPQ